ncbi:MAG: recombinase family protein, partial [Alteromonadaceae bacterium]|nr:recombinase family protein [Alteromonadaceae bacterium]
MQGQNIGYKRVSSSDQNPDRQLADIELDETFQDFTSGKDRERPRLKACLKYCRKGDVLHIHSIDRLARNLGELQTIVDELKAKKVSVQFHKENLIFSGGNNPMDKLLLQVMGAKGFILKNLKVCNTRT